MAKKRGVDVLLGHDLAEVQPESKTAIFQKAGSGDKVQLQYDFLHVTPRMGPPDFIKSSALANPNSVGGIPLPHSMSEVAGMHVARSCNAWKCMLSVGRFRQLITVPLHQHLSLWKIPVVGRDTEILRRY